MHISKLTVKGQVTIPSSIRKTLGLDRGDQVAFKIEEGKIVIVPVEDDVEAAFGLVEATRSVSLEEMDEAIRDRRDK